MYRLINPTNLTFPIGHSIQTRTGQQAQTPRYHTRLITYNIPKQVARDDDPIQRPWVLDHQHSRTIDQMMPKLQLRKLVLHNLANHLPPQPTRSQHVRLVQTPHFLRRLRSHGQMRRQPRHALNLCPGIGFRVPSVPVVVFLLFPLPEVDAPRQLADDGEVDPAADVLFERGDGGQGVGGEVAGAQVAEGVEFFAELEEALFRADGTGAVFLCGWRERCQSLSGKELVEGREGKGREGVRGRLLRLGALHLLFWRQRELRL